MVIKSNLIIGLLNSSCSVILAILMIPIYIKYLGLEAYGLISLYTSMLVFFQVLDFGMHQTLIGEVSRSILFKSRKKIAELVHSMAVINGSIALIIMIMFFIFSDWISSNWFISNSFSKKELKESICLIGILIASRWPILIYQGGLYGMQKYIHACSINMIMVTLNSIGSFVIIVIFEPKLNNIFLWQAFVGISYTLILRSTFWSLFGKIKNVYFSLYEVKKLFNFALQMAGVTISSITLSHIDKIILSKILALNDFAIYMLAYNMSNIFQVIINPVHNILYPKFGELYSKKDFENLSKLYSLSLKSLSSVIFPISLIMFYCSYELTFLYTQDINLAAIIAPILSILTISITFNCLMYIPYTLQLGSGFPKIPLFINVLFLLTLIPLLIFLSYKYGSIGAAFTWLCINSIYFIIGPFITHRYILKNQFKSFYLFDVGPYLILGFIFFFIIQGIFLYIDFNVLTKLLFVVLFAFILFLINVFCSKDLRKLFFSLIFKINIRGIN